MNVATTLLAAASAGLLASALLFSQQVDAPVAQVGLEMSHSTARVLQHCNMSLPTVQNPGVASALNDWAPLWLVAHEKMSIQDQNKFCTQLLSTSLQGPTPDDTENMQAFDAALDDTTQLMLTQVAHEVLAHAELAENIAPLMGLSANDVKHYFKAVSQGSPLPMPGPTPPDGPKFNL